MEMSVGEIFDRYTICKLKSERTEMDITKELSELLSEVQKYPDLDLYIDKLYKVNGDVWDLESDIRKGKYDLLTLEEIGRRSIKLRDLNTVRVHWKNEINSIVGRGYIEVKQDHGSENNPSLIITLTTVPERLSNKNEHGVKSVIKSLCEQNDNDYEVHFNVPFIYSQTNEPYIIPEWIDEYKLKYQHLRVYRTEDIGPPTKMVPTLNRIKNPDTILLVVDDDLIYHTDMVSEHRKYQKLLTDKNNTDCVVCYEGRGCDNPLYHDIRDSWIICVTDIRETHGFQHYKSASYKKKIFNQDFFEYYLGKPLSDDVLVSRYCKDNNIKMFVVPYDKETPLYMTKELWDKYEGVTTFPVLKHAHSIMKTGCNHPELLKKEIGQRFYEPPILGKEKNNNITLITNKEPIPTETNVPDETEIPFNGNIISYWDHYVSDKHCRHEVNYIYEYLKNNNINNINFIDIGSNVGKYYDILLEFGVNISNCVLIEPEPELYNYILNKYKSNNNCKIYNFALSDVNTNGKLNIEQLKYFKNKNDFNKEVNLGCLYLSNNGDGVDVNVVSSLRFFTEIVPDIKFNVIKIGTENRDYHILKSMTEYVRTLEKKPIISFQHNYQNDLSYEIAKGIFDTFCAVCNYKNIGFDNLHGTVFLEPIRII